MDFNLPKIIGHRGVRDLAPENTIKSVQLAIKHKITWVEIDVRISKDKIPYLLHDNFLDRTTSGNGSSNKYDYKYIRSLDAGIWFDNKFKGLYPPTLKEILDICSKKNIGVNIELKSTRGKEKELTKAVIDLLNNYQFKCKYFISSFNYITIKLIRQFMPNSFIGYLVNNIKDMDDLKNIINKCLKIKCFAIGFNINLINKKLISFCKKHNIIITVYSSKSINFFQAVKLLNLGVDSIFIDNPIFFKNLGK